MGKSKSSESSDFTVSGPFHMGPVDWSDEKQKCAVMACLVNAVYILEGERIENKNRVEQSALAPPWWEKFGFQLVHKITDGDSIFGAIFRFEGSVQHEGEAPEAVIAFRGTTFHEETLLKEGQIDYTIISGQLGLTSRYKIARKAVKDFSVDQNVWLAGHSQGASIALLTGAKLAKNGISCETFLYNLPNCFTQDDIFSRVFSPDGMITNLGMKRHEADVLRVMASFFYSFTVPICITYMVYEDLLKLSTGIRDGTVGLAGIRDRVGKFFTDPMLIFKRKRGLSVNFAPHIYVNPKDRICKMFIKFFERISERNERRDIRIARMVKSGVLWINSVPGQGMLEAHELKQWWQLNINLLEFPEYRKKPVKDNTDISNI